MTPLHIQMCSICLVVKCIYKCILSVIYVILWNKMFELTTPLSKELTLHIDALSLTPLIVALSLTPLIVAGWGGGAVCCSWSP